MENYDQPAGVKPPVKSRRGLTILLILLICILAAGIVVLYSQMNKQKTDNAEMQQVLEDQKQSLSKELKDMIGEYDALKSNNDSMNHLIGEQQVKIKKLLNMQASNAVLILKYKKELGTLREVLKSYIVQVDSLNTRNQQLVSENSTVKSNLEHARTENTKISKEKEELSSKVKTASVISCSNIEITPLNKRSKSENSASRILKIKTCFTLRENPIAQPGNRDVYIRITRPDNAVIASTTADMFTFQGQDIVFTAKREVDYENKDIDVCIFWDNESKQLIQGDYTVDIFTDGNLIGTTKFNIKKK